MKYVAYKDVQALLESVRILHSDISQETLPERTLKAVGEVINCEMTTFDGFGSDDKYSFTAWTNREDLLTSKSLQIFGQFVQEHPLIPVVVGGKVQSAIKITDYISQSQFERLGLYNEFFKEISISHQMGLALPIAPDLTISCAVNRAKEDFSERERLILTLIAPHLVNCVRNTFAYERLSSIIEAQSVGVITIDEISSIRYLSEFARQLLEKYFSSSKLDSALLPEALNNWIKHCCQINKDEFHLPVMPLKVAGSQGELIIRLILNSSTREKFLLLEEKRFVTPQMLEQLNLTKREAEVLFWMTQGKTDAEIGEILFISPHTVRKHAQKIYIKLGVETRTAATAKALEIIL